MQLKYIFMDLIKFKSVHSRFLCKTKTLLSYTTYVYRNYKYCIDKVALAILVWRHFMYTLEALLFWCNL